MYHISQMAEDKRLLATQFFTVRFWFETLGDNQHEWRGRVQYIESGEVIYFREWQELFKFIRDHLDGAAQSKQKNTHQEDSNVDKENFTDHGSSFQAWAR